MEDPKKLRALAQWYRDFAERTGNPTIWDCRLRTAEDLDVEAERIERTQAVYHPAIKAEMEGVSISSGDR